LFKQKVVSQNDLFPTVTLHNNLICHRLSGHRAGLNIGQTGQMPGASRFWGPRSWISKYSFTGFSCL